MKAEFGVVMLGYYVFFVAAASEVTAEAAETPAATTNEEVLIQAMDSFNSEDTTLLQQEAKVDEVEKTKTENENSTTTTTAAADVETEQSESDLSEGVGERNICIKLKFINDDQKLVTGSLKEMLGDFKK